MPKSAEVHIIVHRPVSTAGNVELAQRVAHVHASAVADYFKNQECPAEQKIALTNRIIQQKDKNAFADTLLYRKNSM